MRNLSSEQLKELGASYTTKEIYQQPKVWKEMADKLSNEKESINRFLEKMKKKHSEVKVIFTGAGSSAFIGDTLVPSLRKLKLANFEFDSIATTNIVSNPVHYLSEEIPTLLVSFARSGNSPESVASVDIAERVVKNLYQLVVTCNSEGELAQKAAKNPNAYTILTPKKANDKSLAMTSSFSSMMLAAYSVFAFESNLKSEWLEFIVDKGEKLLDEASELLNKLISEPYNKVVYLGSGSLHEIGHESALKLLELSSGKTLATYESSLGFRHGPKAIVDDRTLIVLFLSQDQYTRQYDMDILKELHEEKENNLLVVLSANNDEEAAALADYFIHLTDGADQEPEDIQLVFVYLLFAQLLSLKNSISLGIKPDTPSANGQINRVVQGVTIYPYHA